MKRKEERIIKYNFIFSVGFHVAFRLLCLYYHIQDPLYFYWNVPEMNPYPLFLQKYSIDILVLSLIWIIFSVGLYVGYLIRKWN